MPSTQGPGTDPDAGGTTPESKVISMARRLAGRAVGRLGVPAREWAALIAIVVLAAADRFVNLPNRFIWNTDQGVEVGAIWNAVVTRQLPTFGSPAFSTGGLFHHGALFYDLMIPVAWISNGDPNALVLAIAILGVLVVPLVWWTARSIGGTSAGIAAAVLAAVSPALIDYSTLIWNPVLVETGVALACFGAWQAWSTGGRRWWVVAAAGTAIASQAHMTGLVLVFPMAIFFLVALRRCPAEGRRRLLAWGMAGVALFVLTWMPWIVEELTHNFTETRGILAFSQPGSPAADPISRFVFSIIRIQAWPMTHWPLDDLGGGFPAALLIAVGVTAGLIWRVTGTLSASGTRARGERAGLLFVGGSLLLITTVLGVGIKELGEVENINQEQYHVVADVFVILAAALIVGGLWRATPLRGRPWSGRILAIVAMAGLVATGVAHWPPLTAVDGGWPSAKAAAVRLERDAGAPELSLSDLPSFKGPQEYAYPLTLDGVALIDPADAQTVVILCDVDWAQGCGGTAETEWLAATLPGRNMTLIDRFEPAKGRILSVYRREP